MHNLTKTSNVRNYNPIGNIKKPFDLAGFIGPSGTDVAPRQGQRYTVRGADLLIHMGVFVAATIRDGKGEIFFVTAPPSPAIMPPLMLPVGFSITFDHFGVQSGMVTVAGS
jgi:hypothetical protein